MGSHLTDSKLFGSMFGTKAMKEIFSDEGQVKQWLIVEAAIARAQGDLGIIPKEAAIEISSKAQLKYIDIEALGKEIEVASHPIVPIIKQLERACNNNYGQFVHWGATTQDIMDTGNVLQIKKAFNLIEPKLKNIIRVLMKLAEKHKETIMPGRTHGQHALPITFSFKVSGWIDELGRQLDRLQSLRERVLIGQFSGAVGTLASFNKDGLKVQEKVMDILELKTPKIAWHTSRDNLVEVAMFMGMLMGTMAKIAKEVTILQKTEIKELEEPFKDGQIGSSTMPHKRNPVLCQNIVTISKVVRKNASLVLENMDHEHERDMIRWQVEWAAFPEIFIMSDAALDMVEKVVSNIKVNEKQMRRNIDLTNGLILSESIMLRLGEGLGKQNSHHIILEACMEAINQNQPLEKILLKNKQITDQINEKEIKALLDPLNYIGSSSAIVDNVLAEAMNNLNGDQ